MRAGIFGWSYPPGCSGPPDDEEGPCVLCGKAIDDCTCEECKEPIGTDSEGNDIPCGDFGCLTHLNSGILANLIGLLDYRLCDLRKEAKKREKKTAPCPVCNKETTITIFDDCPIYCCEHEWSETRKIWEKYDYEYL